MFRRFDANGGVAIGFGSVTHVVEEHGFSNSTEADHEDAFGGATKFNALDGDMDCFA